MLTNEQLAELIATIRGGHCRSYVDAAKVLAEEFLPVLRSRVEEPANLAVEYQHMFVNLTNSQAQCTELIQKNREQARQILQLENENVNMERVLLENTAALEALMRETPRIAKESAQP